MDEFVTVALNSSNLESNGYNNLYSISFPSGFNVDQRTSIAVASVSLYFSWFNITAAIGNNRIDLIFPTSSTDLTIQVTIPDGYYSAVTLNQYLQSVQIANGCYMVDSNGNYIYYVDLSTNATYYGLEFVLTNIPTAAPAGYTSHFATLPATTLTPQIVIYDNLSTFLGITAGTYPATKQSSATSKLSTVAPAVDQVQSIILSCDAIDNKLASRPSLLYSFPVNGSFGGLITANPNEYFYMSPKIGNVPKISIELLDQNYRKIAMLDTNVLITLIIKKQKYLS